MNEERQSLDLIAKPVPEKDINQENLDDLLVSFEKLSGFLGHSLECFEQINVLPGGLQDNVDKYSKALDNLSGLFGEVLGKANFLYEQILEYDFDSKADYQNLHSYVDTLYKTIGEIIENIKDNDFDQVSKSINDLESQRAECDKILDTVKGNSKQIVEQVEQQQKLNQEEIETLQNLENVLKEQVTFCETITKTNKHFKKLVPQKVNILEDVDSLIKNIESDIAEAAVQLNACNIEKTTDIMNAIQEKSTLVHTKLTDEFPDKLSKAINSDIEAMDLRYKEFINSSAQDRDFKDYKYVVKEINGIIEELQALSKISADNKSENDTKIDDLKDRKSSLDTVYYQGVKTTITNQVAELNKQVIILNKDIAKQDSKAGAVQMQKRLAQNWQNSLSDIYKKIATIVDVSDQKQLMQLVLNAKIEISAEDINILQTTDYKSEAFELATLLIKNKADQSQELAEQKVVEIRKGESLSTVLKEFVSLPMRTPGAWKLVCESIQSAVNENNNVYKNLEYFLAAMSEMDFSADDIKSLKELNYDIAKDLYKRAVRMAKYVDVVVKDSREKLIIDKDDAHRLVASINDISHEAIQNLNKFLIEIIDYKVNNNKLPDVTVVRELSTAVPKILDLLKNSNNRNIRLEASWILGNLSEVVGWVKLPDVNLERALVTQKQLIERIETKESGDDIDKKIKVAAMQSELKHNENQRYEDFVKELDGKNGKLVVTQQISKTTDYVHNIVREQVLAQYLDTTGSQVEQAGLLHSIAKMGGMQALEVLLAQSHELHQHYNKRKQELLASDYDYYEAQDVLDEEYAGLEMLDAAIEPTFKRTQRIPIDKKEATKKGKEVKQIAHQSELLNLQDLKKHLAEQSLEISNYSYTYWRTIIQAYLEEHANDDAELLNIKEFIKDEKVLPTDTQDAAVLVSLMHKVLFRILDQSQELDDWGRNKKMVSVNGAGEYRIISVYEEEVESALFYKKVPKVKVVLKSMADDSEITVDYFGNFAVIEQPVAKKDDNPVENKDDKTTTNKVVNTVETQESLSKIDDAVQIVASAFENFKTHIGQGFKEEKDVENFKKTVLRTAVEELKHYGLTEKIIQSFFESMAIAITSNSKEEDISLKNQDLIRIALLNESFNNNKLDVDYQWSDVVNKLDAIENMSDYNSILKDKDLITEISQATPLTEKMVTCIIKTVKAAYRHKVINMNPFGGEGTNEAIAVQVKEIVNKMIKGFNPENINDILTYQTNDNIEDIAEFLDGLESIAEINEVKARISNCEANFFAAENFTQHRERDIVQNYIAKKQLNKIFTDSVLSRVLLRIREIKINRAKNSDSFKSLAEIDDILDMQSELITMIIRNAKSRQYRDGASINYSREDLGLILHDLFDGYDIRAEVKKYGYEFDEYFLAEAKGTVAK